MTDRDEAPRETLAAATERLLSLRCSRGHWRGELSDSALSTATAIAALAVAGGHEHREHVRSGLDWLAGHVNRDGGWGDTVRSESNLSTTTLAWSAFAIASADGDETYARVLTGAHAWLTRAAGGLDPKQLAAAITACYGKDRTFAAPILAFCAIAGKLGEPRDAWRLVPALPFELGALSHGALRCLRLPVVSYALPALIAIGQVRHHVRRPANPLARCLRASTRARTLRVLETIQPPGGGFLEAAPLTSFVVLALAHMGLTDHPVVRKGLTFLVETVRDNGCWPIDTDLATWVTTLSVGALAAAGTLDGLDESERGAIRDWILAGQLRSRHPYTGAAPGGWAWTDLPGGVPDADDTAGAMLALHHLAGSDPRSRAAATAGATWLVGLQNRDGGIPTFARGWGTLEFDRSSPDLTAHAISAWSRWLAVLPDRTRGYVAKSLRRALRFLVRSRRDDGAWTPLWFGNERAGGQANPTYGTARVVTALLDLPAEQIAPVYHTLTDGAAWLATAQNDDGGWGGDAGVASSIEETALAVDALAKFASRSYDPEMIETIRRGAAFLIDRTDYGRRFDAAPIGLYFAKLWYFEQFYPVIFTVSALARAEAVLRR